MTTPSVLFSTGTTPKSEVPASVARNTSSMLAHGTPSTERPKTAKTAASLKVPTGPRKATRANVLERTAGAHDLAPDVAQTFGFERPRIFVLDVAQHLGLALGPEHRRTEALFDLADFLREFGARRQQRDELFIDRIDAGRAKA